MTSLRKGLTVWLWAAVGVVGAVCVLIGNWDARTETQAQVDYQMQQVARILASQDFSNPRPAGEPVKPEIIPSININHDVDDDLIATVRDSAGRLLYASSSNRQLPGGVLPASSALGFQTLELGSGRYRVFAAQSNELRIEVAQSVDVIREAEGGIALATLLPIVILLPVLAVVIGLAIRRQLRPLNAAAANIALRPPLSLDLLPAEGMPHEVRPLVDEINRLLRRLRTAVEREQRFVTDAAHALRTPLTALQLQADVLDGGKDANEKAARLADLRAGIRRVVRLSEQLLSLARSESESGPITITTDLDATLAEVAAVYRGAAQASGIDLQLEAASGARVYGNARRLTLIFGNLLDNSLRYTPAGGHVRISAAVKEDRAQIQVWDEGCGVPPQDLERVFERFYRASDAKNSGNGLGLATVETLVRQLGGTVILQNRADHTGLVATVTLPLAPQPPVPEAGPASENVEHDSTAMASR